jgi:RNA polymerase sigma-70 factor, ECF subfamily
MDAFSAELIGLLPRLRSFALGLTLDATSADDLVQAGCERALARRHQWQPGTRLDSWMFKILRNLWIDTIRARAPIVDVEHEELEMMPGEDWNARIEAEMTLEQVTRHLAKLPEGMRSVLMAVCVEGLSYDEAAQLLDIPIGTVMSRLARARVALQKLVDTAPREVPGGTNAAVH